MILGSQPTDLLQQYHTTRRDKTGAGGQSVQVDATGHPLTLCVTSIPGDRITARLLYRVHEPHHFLPKYVVHRERNMCLLRHVVCDLSRWVERIRTVST